MQEFFLQILSQKRPLPFNLASQIFIESKNRKATDYCLVQITYNIDCLPKTFTVYWVQIPEVLFWILSRIRFLFERLISLHVLQVEIITFYITNPIVRLSAWLIHVKFPNLHVDEIGFEKSNLALWNFKSIYNSIDISSLHATRTFILYDLWPKFYIYIYIYIYTLTEMIMEPPLLKHPVFSWGLFIN